MDDRMVRKVLLRAADYIDRGWCRGAYAKTATGVPCFLLSRRAAKWCVRGAIWVAASRMREHPKAALDRAAREVPGGDLVSWNDTVATNKRQVAALLRRAAKEAQWMR